MRGVRPVMIGVLFLAAACGESRNALPAPPTATFTFAATPTPTPGPLAIVVSDTGATVEVQGGASRAVVAEIYYLVGDQVDFDWVRQSLAELPAADR